MAPELWIWDKDKEEWTGDVFYDFLWAERYIIENGGYEKYDIFEKLS